MINPIQNHYKHLNNALAKSNLHIYTFNTKDLPDHNSYNLDIRTEPPYDKIFKELNEFTTNCLYWFECDNENQLRNLLEAYDKQAEALKNHITDPRAIPPRNKPLKSNCIYVGARFGGTRQRDPLSYIAGRMIAHLGYYKKGRTGGVHFAQWAREIDCEVKLNIIVFKEMKEREYLKVIEKLLAISKKPFLGRH